MADDLSLDVEINGKDNTKPVLSALAALNDASDEGAKALARYAKAGEGVEKSLAGVRKAQQAVVASTKQASKSLADFEQDAFKNANLRTTEKGLVWNDSTNRRAKKESVDAAKAQAAADHAVYLELQKQEAQLKQNLIQRGKLVQAAREQRLGTQNFTPYVAPTRPSVETGTGAGSAEAVAKRFAASGFLAAQSQKEQAAATLKANAANLAGAKAAMEHANRLTNLRYSLYDVRNTSLMFAAGMAAVNIGTLKAAADYETAMAQISRTSGATGQELRNIRADFQDLAVTIPTAFGELAKIGTLGGQLNIPADRLAAFTETTAKFSATTNVAAESAATAFGRLDALLDDVNGNYEALGSSILEVGINSVATETEIINTTNQITAAAQQAGFAAKEIIGLAASFASLGVAPEASRGTTIRVFSTINTAVSETNKNLDVLAKFAGTTAADFAKAWKSAPAEAFQSVLNGMQSAAAGGENLENVIRSMGITAVRDINALLKLAQNADIVGSNFAYAARGFDEATALGDAFSVQSETLASKLQMLANSFQALFANLGESGLGPIGAFVNGLNQILTAAADIADSPFVQWFTLVAGAATAVLAVGSLLVGVLARMGTAGIAAGQALSTLKYELLQTTGGAAGASAAVAGLNGTMAAGTVTARGLAVALKGIGMTLAIGAALGVVGIAIDAVANSMKSASDRAKEYYGDLSDLSTALKDDADAIKRGAESYGEVKGEIITVTKRTSDWAAQLQTATGHQATLDGAIESTTSVLKDQTFQIGENARAWAANELASDPAIQKLMQFASGLAAGGGPVLDSGGFLSAMMVNDTDKAKAILAAYQEEIKAYVQAGGSTFGLNINDLTNATNAVSMMGAAFTTAATKTQILNKVMAFTGDDTTNAANAAKYAGEAIDEMAAASDAASDRLNYLRDSLAGAFIVENQFSQAAQDMYALAESVYTGGESFNVFGSVGQENMANLQAAIASTIIAGESMGIDANRSIAAVFLQLQQMGVDTMNLLTSVAGIGGSTLAGIQSAMGNVDNAGVKTMSEWMGEVAGQAKSAANSIGGGGNGGNNIADNSREAAKAVRTLVDYASDVASVFDRSFEIRFGSQNAFDSYTLGWIEMREAADDARESIRNINAELGTLRADKGTMEYFLSVAEMYGDTVRAAEIRAKLGENAAETAEKEAELREEQGKLNKSTKGNTKSAIENRAALQELADAGVEYVESLIAAGRPQAEIDAALRRTKASFEAQAAAAGFARDDIKKYSTVFDDLKRIVATVPKNITVNANANTSPAELALREFTAKAETAGKSAGQSYSKGWKGGVGKIEMPSMSTAYQQYAAEKTRLYNAFMYASTMYQQSMNPYNPKKVQEWGGKMSSAHARWKNYWTGGYTGNGGIRESAGMVHGKEFVVNAENTAKFRPILEAMNKGRMPITPVGVPTGMQVVELSSRDRALLAAAGNVTLTIDGQVVGRATNAANFGAGRRGSN